MKKAILFFSALFAIVVLIVLLNYFVHKDLYVHYFRHKYLYFTYIKSKYFGNKKTRMRLRNEQIASSKINEQQKSKINSEYIAKYLGNNDESVPSSMDYRECQIQALEYEKKGDYNSSIDLWRKYLQWYYRQKDNWKIMYKDSEVYQNIAICHEYLGEFDKAVEAYNAIPEKYIRFQKEVKPRVDFLTHFKDSDPEPLKMFIKAEKYMKEANYERIGPSSYRHRASSERKQYFEKAIALCNEIIQKYPDSVLIPRVLFEMAKCYHHGFEYAPGICGINYPEGASQAIETYRKLIKEYPQNQFADDAQFRIAMVYSFTKDNKNYRKELYKLVQLYPDSMPEEGLEMLPYGYKKKPWALLALFLIGSNSYYCEEYDEAIKYYAELIDKYPDEGFYTGDALYYTGKSYEGKNDFKNAIKTYEKQIAKGVGVWNGSWYEGAGVTFAPVYESLFTIYNHELNNPQKAGEIILDAFKKNMYELRNAPEEFKDNEEVVLYAVSSYGRNFQYASQRLRDDKSTVLAAVKKDDKAFEYVSSRLRNDEEVILAAINKRSAFALRDVSESLKDNKKFMISAVSKNGLAVEYASKKLKKNREVIFAAVKNCGFALNYLSKKVKDDKEVVLAAVSSNGGALQIVSERLKDDKDVALAAVSNTSYAFQYVSKRLQQDQDVIDAEISSRNKYRNRSK